MTSIGFVIESLSYNWSIITHRNSNTNAVGVFHCIILVWLAVSIPVFVNVPVFVGGSFVPNQIESSRIKCGKRRLDGSTAAVSAGPVA